MEQMLRVHRVKFAGKDSVQCHQNGGKKRGEADCGNGVRAGEQEQKDCRLGRNAVGVLLASREVQGRMDVARRRGKPK